ncbi:hypothetical protein ABW636_08220 [Aquimarina sp. 2201CG1-2-11]|uniref:hypothetical protein n=1 Tax=Aquimarina discodermiae TaxID=3231043 RepID=UPI0034620226
MKIIKKQELLMVNGGNVYPLPRRVRDANELGLIAWPTPVVGTSPTPPIRVKEPYYPILPVDPRYSLR